MVQVVVRMEVGGVRIGDQRWMERWSMVVGVVVGGGRSGYRQQSKWWLALVAVVVDGDQIGDQRWWGVRESTERNTELMT